MRGGGSRTLIRACYGVVGALVLVASLYEWINRLLMLR
jgi:hypothetical protein